MEHHVGFDREGADERLGEGQEHQAHPAQKENGEEARPPGDALGTLRVPGPQALAHQGADGVAHPPGGLLGEEDDPHDEGVAGHGRAAEAGDDAHQHQPARQAQHGLEDGAAGQPQQGEHRGGLEPQVAPSQAQPSSSPHQAMELVDHPREAPEGGGDRRARHAQAWNGPQAEDEERGQHDVDGVGQEQRPHGGGRIPRAAQDGADEKQRHDDDEAAQHHLGVGSALCHHCGRGAQGREQRPGEQHAQHRHGQGQQQSEPQGLHRRARGPLGVLLPHAPGDQRGGADGQPQGDGIGEREHRLREAHRGHGLRPQARDEEDVHQGEDGLHHHLQHHGDGQQQERAIHGARAEVLVRAAHRLGQGGTPALALQGGGRGPGGEFGGDGGKGHGGGRGRGGIVAREGTAPVPPFIPCRSQPLEGGRGCREDESSAGSRRWTCFPPPSASRRHNPSDASPHFHRPPGSRAAR
ncbi:conserved hypothetical protein [Stigmatella aurantiaca DW4/3-1]|uniref:Uncharacterized protein n=1 Tax=Stigmatella aurantiaca (strain DW4/3-1) TaxID=378806 RepID=Q08X65_STIAD|nr:conserved hypothetical protein [Stigmatella aurantiaca DW4/3-1]